MYNPFQQAAALIERERRLLDRRYDALTEESVAPVTPGEPGKDLVAANATFDPVSLPPGVRFGGLKRLLLRVLGVYTRGQVLFNGAVVRAVNDLDGRVRTLESAARETKKRLALAEERRELWERRLAERVEILASRLSDVEACSAEETSRRVHTDENQARLREALARVEAVVAGLRGFTEKLDGAQPPAESLGLRAAFHASRLAAPDRLSALEHVEPFLRLLASTADRVGSPSLFVDLECGRGELLERARGAGLDMKGYDGNPVSVFHCRSLGLDARDGTPVEALSAMADSELAGVSALHLLETLSYSEAADVVRLVHRKLRRGGMFVFSSFDPGTLGGLLALHGSPTVRMPVPEPLAAYLLTDAGFSDVDLRPVEQGGAKDTRRLGVPGSALGHSEYCAVGTKS